METTSILLSLAMSLFSILLTPEPALSAPIMFLCNKTEAIGNQNAFLCKFDIHTDHQATEWKATINHFTMSINAITGIMLAMIIVIFVSIVFNIVRYRSNRRSTTASLTELVPQRKSEVMEVNVGGNADLRISNNYEAPIAPGSGTNHIDGGDDYMKPDPIEENLYDQLEHEKELMKKGISTIAIDNAVYNDVGDEVLIHDNLYDAVEFKKPSAVDNAAYGNLDKASVYNKLVHS